MMSLNKILAAAVFLLTPLEAMALPVGEKLNCRLTSDSNFGYLLSQPRPGQYLIHAIVNGKLEGDETSRRAVQKDYGDPLAVYLSSFERFGNYGNYFEVIVDLKRKNRRGQFLGRVMFTEAEYEMEEGKEKETLRPVYRRQISCQPEL